MVVSKSSKKSAVPMPGSRSEAVGRGTASPSTWSFGDGQPIPWEYAPAPEARDVVKLQSRYGLFIGGKEVAPKSGEWFTTIDPVHRGAAGRGSARRRRGRGQGRLHCAAGVSTHVGHDAWPRARQVPLPHRAHPAGAQPRVRGPRDAQQRQAHQGIARRGRAARGGPLLVLRGLGGQAGVRVRRPVRPSRWVWRRRSSPGTSRC